MSPVKIRLVCSNCEVTTKFKLKIPELVDWKVNEWLWGWGICPDCLREIQEDHIGKVEELKD